MQFGKEFGRKSICYIFYEGRANHKITHFFYQVSGVNCT